METGEPTPKTWADVGQAVNAKLKSIATNLPGLVDDMIVGGRKFMRGFAQILAALARRIDRAHEEADRVEAVRQEKMEARALPPPAAEETVDRLESLLFHLQLDGAAVEIRELEDGRQAILIVKPQDRQIAAKLAAKALPAPAKGRKGRSKAKPPTGEANPPKPKTKSQTRPQKKDSNPGTPE